MKRAFLISVRVLLFLTAAGEIVGAVHWRRWIHLSERSADVVARVILCCIFLGSAAIVVSHFLRKKNGVISPASL
jgi:hypothetical protein